MAGLPPLTPVAESERYASLDALRGVALFGVLTVNLLMDFRVSLFEHIRTFHTHPGHWNRLVDLFVAGAIEFKAFALFSLLFGIGVAVQAERAWARGVPAERFLARRFAALLALGLCHMLLIWNGDILTLYAICGFALLLFLRLPAALLLAAGAAAIVLPSIVPLPIPWPSVEAVRAHAGRATQVYGAGGFFEIARFRWEETGPFIVPLLEASLPRTLGIMLCGMAAWRAGVVRDPERKRGLLITVFLVGGALGATATSLQVYARSTGRPASAPEALLETGSVVPLAFAYGAGFLLWLRGARWTAPFAAAGRTAFTNYVAQSILLGLIFYGYGLGLFGRLGSAAAACIGVALYAGQLWFSVWWLDRFHFGPLEWLWRTLTYGRAQPMRRSSREKNP